MTPVGRSVRFVINEPDVAATVMDGEAIMINISLGTYYSTNSTGAAAWELAAAGYSAGEIAQCIADATSADGGVVLADVQFFLRQCMEEGLLKEHQLDTPGVCEDGLAKLRGEAYAPPTLEAYREMAHLLALDPPMPGLENVSWEDAPEPDLSDLSK
jgi:hypothetical protein